MRSAILWCLLLSSFLVDCSSANKSSREMSVRGGFGLPERGKSEKIIYVPSRKKERVERVYITRKFLPSGDWLVKATVDLVVEDQEYLFDDPLLKKRSKKRLR